MMTVGQPAWPCCTPRCRTRAVACTSASVCPSHIECSLSGCVVLCKINSIEYRERMQPMECCDGSGSYPITGHPCLVNSFIYTAVAEMGSRYITEFFQLHSGGRWEARDGWMHQDRWIALMKDDHAGCGIEAHTRGPGCMQRAALAESRPASPVQAESEPISRPSMQVLRFSSQGSTTCPLAPGKELRPPLGKPQRKQSQATATGHRTCMRMRPKRCQETLR